VAVSGGGGRKVPPGGPSPPATSSSPTEKKPASTPPKAAATPPTSAPPPSARDGFEGMTSDPRVPVERLAAPEVVTTSGVDSMVRVLEDTKTQILEEHKHLRAKLSRLIAELVANRFERSALEERRADILALRTRLAALRKRLSQIQRRLKTVGRARHADADLSKQLSTQLDKLRKLEPGLARALLALQLMEAAVLEGAGGSVFKHGGAIDADVGDELARSTPGQHVVAGVVGLLGAGDASATAAASAPSTPAAPKDGLAALRDVASALKGSFSQ